MRAFWWEEIQAIMAGEFEPEELLTSPKCSASLTGKIGVPPSITGTEDSQ